VCVVKENTGGKIVEIERGDAHRLDQEGPNALENYDNSVHGLVYDVRTMVIAEEKNYVKTCHFDV